MRDGNSRTPDGPAEPDDAQTAANRAGEDDADTTGEIPTDGRGEPASVHVIVQDDRTRIVLSGEVDADLAADLAEATSDAEATGLPIDIDAQHVTFMDSSGIAFLARIATRSNQKVRILRAPETVRFLLQVTRIGELLELVDDPDEAQAEDPAHGLPTIGPGGRSPQAVAPGPDDVA
ncbi:STAS domain-containing protein [Actinotalea ferrariae]|uniref:STAS domain-containing protein n=1 Tax=Actinotalea ferrariae TaxID=1386098 RepID=UPI001C8C8DE4|nr:STAS domain-containing protein [Actinotalea ferrariae]MBX9244797.1 STAS domain-containing protein [Actinotalea ferrariae]